MSFQHGAGFRVVGAVVRKYANNRGTFAGLTLDVVGAPRSKKIDLRAFDEDIVHQIAELGDGQTIEVTGSVDMESVKSKDKKEILVDGRAKWVTVLTVKAIKVEGSSVQPSSPNGRAQAPTRPAPAQPTTKPRGWNEDDEPPF